MKIPSWSHGPASAIGRYFLRFAKFAYLNLYDLTVSSNKTRVEQSRMHSGNINKQSRPDGTIRKLYKHIGTLLGDAAGVRRSRPALSISVQFIQTIARVLAHLCASTRAPCGPKAHSENYIWHLYDRDFVGTPPKVLHHRGVPSGSEGPVIINVYGRIRARRAP